MTDKQEVQVFENVLCDCLFEKAVVTDDDGEKFIVCPKCGKEKSCTIDGFFAWSECGTAVIDIILKGEF